MNIQVSITHPASPLLQQMTLHMFINLLSFLTGWCEAESAPEYLWLLQGWFHESQCQQPFPEASTELWWQGQFISELLPMKPLVELPLPWWPPLVWGVRSKLVILLALLPSMSQLWGSVYWDLSLSTLHCALRKSLYWSSAELNAHICKLYWTSIS